MHRTITQNNKYSSEDGETNDIRPEGLCVEPECAQDGRSGNSDVKANLFVVINEGQKCDLVNN